MDIWFFFNDHAGQSFVNTTWNLKQNLMKDYSDTKVIFPFFFFLQLHFQKSSAVFSFISLLNQDGHMLVHMPNGSGKGSLHLVPMYPMK